jgi:hypothetical protein
MQFMYGHVFGAHARKPHIDTVRAINKSNVDPYITSPFGVDVDIAKPGPRKSPFIEEAPANTEVETYATASEPAMAQAKAGAQPTAQTQTQVQHTIDADIDDIINMITSDPQLKSQLESKKNNILRKVNKL